MSCCFEKFITAVHLGSPRLSPHTHLRPFVPKKTSILSNWSKKKCFKLTEARTLSHEIPSASRNVVQLLWTIAPRFPPFFCSIPLSLLGPATRDVHPFVSRLSRGRVPFIYFYCVCRMDLSARGPATVRGPRVNP